MTQDSTRPRARANPPARRKQDLSWHALTGTMDRVGRRGDRGIGMEVACWAAEQGDTVLAMVPLINTDGEKKPMEKWKTLGYRSPEEIREAGVFRQRCGVAILTGRSGKVVVDIDGEAGVESLVGICGDHELPRTRALATRKGEHKIFLDDGIAYKTQEGQIASGIDIRGRGGIEVIYDPGQPDRHFTDLAEPVSVPSWLAQKIPKAGEPKRGDGNGLDVARLVDEGIPPGQHDGTMLRLAMKLCAHKLIDRGGWPALAAGILQRSGEGVDGNGRSREKFSDDRIMGWWDSAVLRLAEDGGIDPDSVEEILKSMKTRYLAQGKFERWVAAEQPGDEDAFEVVDWSTVDEEDTVPLGADGICPESGRIWISGQAGAGKSLLGYFVLLRRVRATGKPMAVYEAEMGGKRVKRTLRMLGATDDEVGLVRYYRARGGGVADLVRHGRALDKRLLADGIDAVLYDAAGPLLAAAKMNENLAPDVLAWVGAAVDPIAMRGGWVYIIDHEGWSTDGRPRASSAKPAAGDMIVSLKTTKPFKRGVSGSFNLYCSKDRDGEYTGSSLDVEVVADTDCFHVELKTDGWLGGDMSEPKLKRTRSGSGGPDTQTRIEAAMAAGGRPVRVAWLAQQTGLSLEAIRSALRRGATGPKARFMQVEKLWTLKPVG